MRGRGVQAVGAGLSPPLLLDRRGQQPSPPISPSPPTLPFGLPFPSTLPLVSEASALALI